MAGHGLGCWVIKAVFGVESQRLILEQCPPAPRPSGPPPPALGPAVRDNGSRLRSAGRVRLPRPEKPRRTSTEAPAPTWRAEPELRGAEPERLTDSEETAADSSSTRQATRIMAPLLCGTTSWDCAERGLNGFTSAPRASPVPGPTVIRSGSGRVRCFVAFDPGLVRLSAGTPALLLRLLASSLLHFFRQGSAPPISRQWRHDPWKFCKLTPPPPSWYGMNRDSAL